MSYSRKRIIKGAKFHLQNFVGLARTVLKNYYQITIICYAKLALTRRKCFIEWECVSSHPANHQLTYQSSLKNRNPIPKSVWITTICMEERGSMIMSSKFLTPRTIIWHNPIHKNSGTVWFSTEEMRNTPGTTHDCSPEISQTKSAT